MLPVTFHSCSYGGFKVAVRAGDYFSVWGPDHEIVLQLDAALVLEMLAARFRDARILGAILARSNPLERRERLTLIPAPPRKPPVKITADQRAAYRAQRKQRARHQAR